MRNHHLKGEPSARMAGRNDCRNHGWMRTDCAALLFNTDTFELGEKAITLQSFMPFLVNPDATSAKSRVALIHVLNLNLRLMEGWRRVQTGVFGAPLDVESTMILMAIIAIGAENLVRTGDLKKFEDQSTPIDFQLLRKCNLSSIAETTGLNREMVRRRVGSLEKKGILVREEDGGVRMADGILELTEVRESVRSQLVAMASTLDRLRKDGLIEYPDKVDS